MSTVCIQLTGTGGRLHSVWHLILWANKPCKMQRRASFTLHPRPRELARFTDLSPNMRTCIQAQGFKIVGQVSQETMHEFHTKTRRGGVQGDSVYLKVVCMTCEE